MTRTHSNHLYCILGAQPCSDASEIRTKYRQAALRLHPDKGGTSEAFHLLTFAFEVLSCPFARAIYDRSCQQTPRSPNKVATTHTMPCCPDPVSSKRPVPASTAEPPRKRQRASQTNAGGDPEASLQERMASIGIPVQQLRNVLQSMQADERRAALQSLSPRVQAALMLIMKNTPAPDLTPAHKRSAEACPMPQEEKLQSESQHSADLDPFAMKTAAVSGITAGANASSSYKAHVHIKALRFYTRGHDELEVALERQMVLVQLRQALSAASVEDPLLWEDPAKAYDIFLTVLRTNNTSEEEMGLSAFIYLRAGHWLVQSCTIISPVMPLREVLQVHCRLLRARRTSWQDLRAEWVELLQSKHHAIAKRKSLREAEAIADAARASALKIQLAKAASNVCKALDFEEVQTARRCKVLMQREACKERRAAKAKFAEVTMQRGVAKAQKEAWKERKRWLRESDRTIGDIMHGPPRSVAASC